MNEYEGCVGVDIGGQSVRVGVLRDGRLDVRHFETPPVYADARKKIIQYARELVGGTPLGIGVGSPGPLDWRTGRLAWTPNIPWKDVDYAELGTALGCPCAVDNDANVAGLAEGVLGAGRHHNVVCGFTLGTGIGYFANISNHIYHGHFDVEGGHQLIDPKGDACGCGSRGCLETFAGARYIHQRTGKNPDEIDDPAFWTEIGRYLAWGIYNVSVLVNPDAFVLCGGMIKRGETLFAPIRERLAELSKILPPPPVLPAELGSDAGVYGGICLAKQGHPSKNPS